MKYENTDEKGFVRDMNSNALLANDTSALKMHRQKIKQLKVSQNAVNEINNINDRVDQLNGDIKEIKELLLKLVIGNQN